MTIVLPVNVHTSHKNIICALFYCFVLLKFNCKIFLTFDHYIYPELKIHTDV